jgi:hypothetical protein
VMKHDEREDRTGQDRTGSEVGHDVISHPSATWDRPATLSENEGRDTQSSILWLLCQDLLRKLAQLGRNVVGPRVRLQEILAGVVTNRRPHAPTVPTLFSYYLCPPI